MIPPLARRIGVLILFAAIVSPISLLPRAARAADAIEGETVKKIAFQGNRKTEDEAIRARIGLREGDRLTKGVLRNDVRAIWRMNYFEDVRVQVDDSDGGLEVTFVVVEKPTIRKIYIEGAQEVGLEKINEVLDLKRDTILDLAKVKRNAEKIRDVYVDKGFYLAEVTSRTERKSQNEIDVYFHVDEHAKVEVRQVRFLGNQAIDEAQLRSVIGTQEGGWLSFITSSGTYREEAFDRDILLLTAHYYDHGYLNVKFGKPEVELSADKKYLYITIPVDEGPQFRIGKLDFKGDMVAPRDTYFSRLSVKSGDYFNRSRLGQDIIKLNDLYKDKGFAYVNVNPLTNINADVRTVDITFEIQQGRKVFFERINVRGNVKTRDKVIRRELKVAEGEMYNQAMLDLSKRRVQALGYFEKVELSTRRGSADDKIEVNIEVTERPTGTFQIGAGFSSVENFVGQAQISQNNLFGRGHTLQLQASVSSLRQFFTLRFIDPYFLDTPLTFAFTLYNSVLAYPSFNRTSRGGDVTFGYLVSDNVRVFGTYKLETVSVEQATVQRNIGGFGLFAGAAPGTISNLYRSGITSSMRASVNWDTRNDRMFPTKGVFMSASAEVADPYTASQTIFTRFSGFARIYYPLWGPFIFRTNLELGLITSRDPRGVPVYERYFLGGINTIRGYKLWSLGPRINPLSEVDPSANLAPFIIGGNFQTILNTEIEFLIFPQLQIKGVIFFDAGNAYNTERRHCSNGDHRYPQADPCNLVDGGFGGFARNLRTSVGFGFRWFSPIGPLRFEWGIPINRLPDEDPIVFEFTIGNFF